MLSGRSNRYGIVNGFLRTTAAVYICIALEPVILQLICTQNLVQVLHRYNISQVTRSTHHLKLVPLAPLHLHAVFTDSRRPLLGL